MPDALLGWVTHKGQYGIQDDTSSLFSESEAE
jgi:hypothetical protein